MKTLALLVFLAPSFLGAQAPPAVMEITASTSAKNTVAGGKVSLRIEASLKPGWHGTR